MDAGIPAEKGSVARLSLHFKILPAPITGIISTRYTYICSKRQNTYLFLFPVQEMNKGG